MGSIFGSKPDTSALDKRNAELEKKQKEIEESNKRDADRAFSRNKKKRGRASLINTSENGINTGAGTGLAGQGLPETLA